MPKKKRKKRNLKDIIASKKKIHSCPRCWASMDYIEVRGAFRKWAPHEYVWKCVECVFPVYILDGDIDPTVETWEKKRRRLERKQLLNAISSVIIKRPASGIARGSGLSSLDCKKSKPSVKDDDKECTPTS